MIERKKPKHLLKTLFLTLSCFIFLISCSEKSTFESEFDDLKVHWDEIESSECKADLYYDSLNSFNKRLKNFNEKYYTNEKLPKVISFFKEFHQINLQDIEEQLGSISRTDNPNSSAGFKFKNIDDDSLSCVLASSLLKQLQLNKKDFKAFITTTFSKKPKTYSEDFKKVFNHFANILYFGDSANEYSEIDLIESFYEADYFSNMIILNGYYGVESKLPIERLKDKAKKEYFLSRIFYTLLPKNELDIKRFEKAKYLFNDKKEFIKSQSGMFRDAVFNFFNDEVSSKDINQLIELQIDIDKAHSGIEELGKTIALIVEKDIPINLKTYKRLLREYSPQIKFGYSKNPAFYRLLGYGFKNFSLEKEALNEAAYTWYKLALEGLMSYQFGVDHLSGALRLASLIGDRETAESYLEKYIQSIESRNFNSYNVYEDSDFIDEYRKHEKNIKSYLDDLNIEQEKWFNFPKKSKPVIKLILSDDSKEQLKVFLNKINSIKYLTEDEFYDYIYQVKVNHKILAKTLYNLDLAKSKEILLTLKVINTEFNIDKLFRDLSLLFLKDKSTDLFKISFIISNESFYRNDIAQNELPELIFTNKIRVELYNEILEDLDNSNFITAISVVGGCNDRYVNYDRKTSTRIFTSCLVREFKLSSIGINQAISAKDSIKESRKLLKKVSSSTANILRMRLLHFAGKDIPKDFVEELFLSLNGFDSENSSTKKINKVSVTRTTQPAKIIDARV